jgi:hypothetical protein
MDKGYRRLSWASKTGKKSGDATAIGRLFTNPAGCYGNVMLCSAVGPRTWCRKLLLTQPWSIHSHWCSLYLDRFGRRVHRFASERESERFIEGDVGLVDVALHDRILYFHILDLATTV